MERIINYMSYRDNISNIINTYEAKINELNEKNKELQKEILALSINNDRLEKLLEEKKEKQEQEEITKQVKNKFIDSFLKLMK